MSTISITVDNLTKFLLDSSLQFSISILSLQLVFGSIKMYRQKPTQVMTLNLILNCIITFCLLVRGSVTIFPVSTEFCTFRMYLGGVGTQIQLILSWIIQWLRVRIAYSEQPIVVYGSLAIIIIGSGVASLAWLFAKVALNTLGRCSIAVISANQVAFASVDLFICIMLVVLFGIKMKQKMKNQTIKKNRAKKGVYDILLTSTYRYAFLELFATAAKITSQIIPLVSVLDPTAAIMTSCILRVCDFLKLYAVYKFAEDTMSKRETTSSMVSSNGKISAPAK
ncbi:hypothetical protein HDV02_004893 [Globomyces sp. JEL0801]|nr:hypothetical protein HDV02_004893 [Globomyces sp. JEL0801]